MYRDVGWDVGVVATGQDRLGGSMGGSMGLSVRGCARHGWARGCVWAIGLWNFLSRARVRHVAVFLCVLDSGSQGGDCARHRVTQIFGECLHADFEVTISP